MIFGGSPPRGRGKDLRHTGPAGPCRITPAWAGKSTWSPSFKDLRQDHPRVGGEKRENYTRTRAHVGSPPRGRGKVRFGIHTPVVNRITPAWAGKSFNVTFVCVAFEDHPRVGGEKRLILFVFRAVTGSPPRGRGKDIQCTNGKKAQRITPAWAGKRIIQARRCRRSHGSPPRGRGKAFKRPAEAIRTWITPAWAGKSAGFVRTMDTQKDHPRVGGEKLCPCSRYGTK